MCDWGTDTEVEVTIPAELSCTGKPFKKKAKIDSCIAPIVEALEKAGITMRASCCGHGKGDGYIVLNDGKRVLVIMNKKRYGELLRKRW